MNKQIFCSRKGGATIGKRFFPLRASDIMAHQIERHAEKMEERQRKRDKTSSKDNHAWWQWFQSTDIKA